MNIHCFKKGIFWKSFSCFFMLLEMTSTVLHRNNKNNNKPLDRWFFSEGLENIGGFASKNIIVLNLFSISVSHTKYKRQDNYSILYILSKLSIIIFGDLSTCFSHLILIKTCHNYEKDIYKNNSNVKDGNTDQRASITRLIYKRKNLYRHSIF